jgi:flagellar hook-basal body complex protein FliE
MISPIQPISVNGAVGSTAGGSGPSFGQLVQRAVGALQTAQETANEAIRAASVGQGSVTQAMVVMTQAQMMLDVAVSVESGAAQAYQTIMNMPLS